MGRGLTLEEEDEYWEEVHKQVKEAAGIQWGDEESEPEETLEEPESAPKRQRDTSLGIPSSTQRRRDRHLPRRKGTT
jgi:hypothetical protein